MKGSVLLVWKNKEDNLVEFDFNTINKPIIIYQFINPFCHNCWQLEMIMKKLAIEYGQFFTIRPIISLDSSSPKKIIKQNICFLKQNLGLAIKAAELQGNKSGRQFLGKIQEGHFLYDDDFLNDEVLMNYATLIDLDLNEFSNDVFSNSAKKAYQTDVNLIKEMNIKEFPSLVFSSKHNEQHNLKITGLADYDSYVHLLYKLLNNKPMPQEKPPVHLFLKEQGLLSLENIAFIYDWSFDKTKKILNELKLKGQVEELTILSRKYWSYQN